MLPSDYSGAPPGAIAGNVVRQTAQRDADRPRLSLEWLAALAPGETGPALIGQPLTFQRSTKLQNDWDIGLGLPSDEVKFELPLAMRDARIGIGKMVYFDDRMADGRLDWSCTGAGCDRIKSVSAQFVVYVETPPLCQNTTARGAQPRLRAGYHYYSFDGGVARELAPAEAMSFTLIDRAPADIDLPNDLRAFADALRRAWSFSTGDGC
jgi:hypothetical protein